MVLRVGDSQVIAVRTDRDRRPQLALGVARPTDGESHLKIFGVERDDAPVALPEGDRGARGSSCVGGTGIVMRRGHVACHAHRRIIWLATHGSFQREGHGNIMHTGMRGEMARF